jgi:hypothetical protein
MNENRSNDDLDALADRLRALPAPPVPSGLEARLLAAVPDAVAFAPGPRPRRWGGRLALAGALAAAAVLLAVLLGRFVGQTDRPPDGPHPPPVPQAAAEQLPTLGNYRRAEDAALLPCSFEWPVQLTVPVAARHRPEERID